MQNSGNQNPILDMYYQTVTRRPRTFSLCLAFSCAVIFFHADDVISFSVDNNNQRPTQRSTKGSNKRAALSPDILSRVRSAMDASSRSATNITAAYDACERWNELFSLTTTHQTTNKKGKLKDTTTTTKAIKSGGDLMLDNYPDIRAICSALHASCLVRIGRDDLAVKVYDTCLNDQSLQGYLTTQTRHDMILGKGYALQRLLKYDLASQTFQLLASSSTKAGCGAATCLLRQGKIDIAKSILQDFCSSNNDKDRTNDETFEAEGMLGTLIFHSHLLKDNDKGKNHQETQQEGLANLDIASKTSLLYSWIRHVILDSIGSQRIQRDYDNDDNKQWTFLDLIQINQSPFDDPGLVNLDDKVNLHRLLCPGSTYSKPSTTPPTTEDQVISSFWPKSIVVSTNSSQPDKWRKFILSTNETENHAEDSDLWFVKDRAGYGSHGNRILTTPQALTFVDDLKRRVDSQEEKEEYLLQRMVQPAMLLDGGRKFSIRVYAVIVYAKNSTNISTSESRGIYLSQQGLVKFASVPLHPKATSTKETTKKTQRDDKQEDEDVTMIDHRVHMTNSGRENNMIQRDLEYLKQELDNHHHDNGWSYAQLWRDIQTIVRTVMQRYYDNTHDNSSFDQQVAEESQQYSTELQSLLRIPKILAFDLVLDNCCKPWLVEVNRFPGLEPRIDDNANDEDGDRYVKHQVVKDAWIAAAVIDDTTVSFSEDDNDISNNNNKSSNNHPMKSILTKLDCDHDKVHLERIM